MKPAMYHTLTYDQKILYLQTVFAAASAKHPVYAKMHTLLTGWNVDETYLDMLYDTVNNLVGQTNSLAAIRQLEDLALKLQRIRELEEQDRLQEQGEIVDLEAQIMQIPNAQ